MKSFNVLFSALAVVALLLVAAACGGGSDKSGGDAPTTTLRLATMEGQGAPYADSVEEFARQVEELSDGSLRLQVVWSGADELLGGYGPRAEQEVAGLVQSGKLAAAVIPARAWDELGVTSLQALQAPLLVSSEELVEQIVQSKLAEEMLAGLDKAGIVGLTLIPEGLRHPVGFARPFLTLEDFAGAKVRAPLSNASYRLLEALGAKPVDICCDEFSQAVATGEIDGAESGFAWGGDLPRPGTFTANLTFYPKVNAIVVNRDAFGRLSDEHRELLREAAAKALRHSLRNDPSEGDRAAVYCRNGGAIAFASDTDVAALERAADPVYRALEADPQTKELIEQIKQMKEEFSGGGDPVPDGCTPPSGGRVPPTSSAPDPSEFPEGVYRVDLPAEYLIEKGMDPTTAHELGGIRTLTFEDGRWRDHTRGVAEDCVGLYSVEAGRVSLRQDRAECGEPAGTLVMSARWTLKDGELRFFDFRRGRPLEWGSKPWTKID
jgi:TRAP-type C4-dicarboxylate transport system substrate-binding protein